MFLRIIFGKLNRFICSLAPAALRCEIYNLLKVKYLICGVQIESNTTLISFCFLRLYVLTLN